MSFGRRISRRELERLAKRLDELRELRQELGITDVEMLTALISMEDLRKTRRKVIREQTGEDDDDFDDEEDDD